MSKDPLVLGDLNPEVIDAQVASRNSKKKAPPNELEIKKEERLAAKEQRMAAQFSGSVPPSNVPVVPGGETVDKSKLLDKIQMYRERFPHLKQRNKTGPKSSVEEIQDELHYIELQLSGSGSDGSVGMMMLLGAMTGLELVTHTYNPLNLNLQGLTQITRDNSDTFQPIVDELTIKYGGGMYVAPEYRLLFAIGATVYSVHTANSGDPTIAAAMHKMSKQVPPVAASKKDL